MSLQLVTIETLSRIAFLASRRLPDRSLGYLAELMVRFSACNRAAFHAAYGSLVWFDESAVPLITIEQVFEGIARAHDQASRDWAPLKDEDVATLLGLLPFHARAIGLNFLPEALAQELNALATAALVEEFASA